MPRRTASISSTSQDTHESALQAAQELASVSPADGEQTAWLGWPFVTGAGEVPPLPPGTLPEVTPASFRPFLRGAGRHLEAFLEARKGVREHLHVHSPEELRSSQGQGLVAAMREVPAMFFQEAFDLDRPEVWAGLDAASEEGRQMALERLSHHLDVVEGHLVREIAARYDSFFDASGYIQDVRGSVVRLYEQVAAVHKQMHAVEQESASAVATAQALQRQRHNLLATLELLQAVEGVAQALQALQALLSSRAVVDYAGAIDVLEVLQGALDNEELLGLECFRRLPDQLVEAAQAVDELMVTDFLERGKLSAEPILLQRLTDRLAAQLALSAAAAEGNGHAAQPQPQQGQHQNTQAAPGPDLPAAGELAGEQLVNQAGLERVVAWVKAGMPADASDMAQDPLLPLVMGLRRMGRLSGAMHDLQAASKAHVRELLLATLDASLAFLAAESSSAVDGSHLTARQDGQATSPAAGSSSSSAVLAQLPGPQFHCVLQAVLLAAYVYLEHVQAFCAAVNGVLATASSAAHQVNTSQHDGRECCQAVAEAVAARWSKLLAARAHGDTASALRVHEISQVLATTELLAALVKRHGARSVAALGNAATQLCRAALQAMHQRSLDKLTALLESEQWSAKEVHPDFQLLVSRLEQSWAAAAAAEGSSSLSSSLEVPARQQQAAATATAAAAEADASSSHSTANGTTGHMRQVSSEGGSIAEAGNVPRKFTITPHAQEDGPAPAAGTGSQQQQQRQSEPTLVVGGQGYHVVNTQLVLLRMLAGYLEFTQAVPALAPEVAQRALELLKVFNSRTCQLVLGAGAMHVSGLKSITAKHLAVSCQCLSAFVALHPALAAAFLGSVAPPRRDMLAADFQRTLQDYVVHHDEIIAKLVSIMRERLGSNIKQLPALAEAWPRGATTPTPPAPSSFAATNAKQLQILSSVLSPLLLPEELHTIFGRVQLMFSCTLAEAYSLLEPQGPAWEQQLHADVASLLDCLRRLPADPAGAESNLERLSLLARATAWQQPAVSQAQLQRQQQQASSSQQQQQQQQQQRVPALPGHLEQQPSQPVAASLQPQDLQQQATQQPRQQAAASPRQRQAALQREEPASVQQPAPLVLLQVGQESEAAVPASPATVPHDLPALHELTGTADTGLQPAAIPAASLGAQQPLGMAPESAVELEHAPEAEAVQPQAASLSTELPAAPRQLHAEVASTPDTAAALPVESEQAGGLLQSAAQHAAGVAAQEQQQQQQQGQPP